MVSTITVDNAAVSTDGICQEQA